MLVFVHRRRLMFYQFMSHALDRCRDNDVGQTIHSILGVVLLSILRVLLLIRIRLLLFAVTLLFETKCSWTRDFNLQFFDWLK